MQQIEIDFFNAYKEFDALLGGMLGSDHGVGDYIEAMESTSTGKAKLVPTFYEDLKELKHLRFIRNKIAHETSDAHCTKEDLDLLTDFHERALVGQDPLAVIKRGGAKPKAESKPTKKEQKQSSEKKGSRKTGISDMPDGDLLEKLRSKTPENKTPAPAKRSAPSKPSTGKEANGKKAGKKAGKAKNKRDDKVKKSRPALRVIIALLIFGALVALAIILEKLSGAI